jgi:Tol biopolymer transport system component/uncharacterized protein YcbK (DUF882 family)
MRKAAVLAALAIAVACTDHNPVGPVDASISDASHESGNAHFHFLPPMVPAPSPRGAFDGSLAPVVQICEWLGTACATPLLAEFTATSGPGSETVRLVLADQLYLVNWHTDQFAVSAGKMYRIRVLVAGTELGHADVTVVGSSKEVKNVETGQLVPLVDGRTLPIKFRIEDGAVFVVGANGGTLVAVDGRVVLAVPPDATGDLGITVVPAASPPASVGLLPGTVFDFGPQGTTFARPVRLSIAYDEATLPAGQAEANLTLLTEHEGLWQEIADGVVDADANVVSGFVTGFSRKGVGGKVGSVDIDPISANVSVCATQQFTAIVRAPDGTPLTGRQVVWSSSANAIAVVDRNGVARGAAAGTAMIVVASGGEADTATMTVAASPGVTSCTNIVEMDATALSAPQFSVSGTGTYATRVVTALSLVPGDYALSAADGHVPFTVTTSGTVDYAVALDGVLTGRGTTRLTAIGAAITIDARALTAPLFSIGGVGTYPTASPAALRLLPNIDAAHFYGFAASDGQVFFGVTETGVTVYAPALEGILTGRGTTTLTAIGAAITINAAALSAPQFSIGGVGTFPTTAPVALRLLPNIDVPHFYGLGASDGQVRFGVNEGGMVDYAPTLEGILAGRGTATLAANGLAVTIDATALSAPQVSIGGVGTFPATAPVALRLLPNIDAPHFYGLGSSDGQVRFGVTEAGVVDYAPTLEAILMGKGTATLVANGVAITIDATALSAPILAIGGVGAYPTTAPVALRLLPNIDAPHFYGLGASDGQVRFGVTEAGVVDYAPTLEGMLTGKGTAALVVHGVAITVEATALSAPIFAIGGVGAYPTTGPVALRLLPNIDAPHFYGFGASDGQVRFGVTEAGMVDYPPTLEGMLTGKGTATLVVHGVAITVDATRLSAPAFSIGGVASAPTSTPLVLRLLPNIDAAHFYGFAASDGQVYFGVTEAGVVDYDAALDGILTGRGTVTLAARGADITIDATALSSPTFSIGGMGTYPTSAPGAFHMLPNIDAQHAYGFGSPEFSFQFVVTTSGTVDYNPSLDSRLVGRSTNRMTITAAPMSRILFESDRDGDREIYAMNPDGTGVTRLTNSPDLDANPVWSSDRSRILFESVREGNSDLYVMNADGSNPTRITDDVDVNEFPSWSPDGTRIAFQVRRDLLNYDVYVMSADGSSRVQLTNDPAFDGMPAWSPDGTRIAFVTARDGDHEIYVMNSDGSSPRRLTFAVNFDGYPSWSPDGTRIAFYGSREGDYEIYLMNSDGTGQTRVTVSPGFDAFPSWSPDGSKLVFHSQRGGNSDIYVMNPDGTGVTRLTNNPGIDAVAAWTRR